MSAFATGIRAIPTRYLVFLILALFLPAHLINLGLAAFNGDEAIRSLVALEMDLSGNYIAPTMHGTPYINKPPLFNWLLLLSFKMFGYPGEFPARAVTVFFLAVYGFTVYRFVRLELGPEFAFLTAMMTVLSGRFLIYDSMLGLIDTAFTAVAYTLFMSVWYYGSRGQWQRLFLASYLLMAAGFLLKGLPAIVFQGFTLLAGAYFFQAWRRLFSWQHVFGGLAGLLLLGAYLTVYAQYRPLEILLPNFFNESVKRTGVAFGWWDTLLHLLAFPFESVYHFLPFSLLILAWIDRHFWKRARENRFVWFNFVVLAANLPIYWSSVQVYARYLLMFIPLFTTLSFYLMEKHREERGWAVRAFHGVLGLLVISLPLAFAAMPWVPEVNFLKNIGPLSLGFSLALALIAIAFFCNRARALYWMVIALLTARIAFDLIILPARHYQNDTSNARDAVRETVDRYRNRKWYVYADSYIREPASFYMTQGLGYIVERRFDILQENAVLLANPTQEPNAAHIFGRAPADTLETDYPHEPIWLFLPERR